MWPVLQVACEISTPVPLTRTHGHALLQKRLGNIKQLVPKRKRKQISQTIVILPQALLSCAPYPGSQQHLLDDDAEQFTTYSFCFRASLVAQTVKNPSAMWEISVRSPGWEDPLEARHGNPLQYSCLESSHGQRSLVGYSPWDRKESDRTEHICLSWTTWTEWIVELFQNGGNWERMEGLEVLCLTWFFDIYMPVSNRLKGEGGTVDMPGAVSV